MQLRIKLALLILCSTHLAHAYERSDHSQEMYLGYGGGSYQDVTNDNLVGGVLSVGYDINSFFAIESQFGMTAVNKQEQNNVSLETQMSHASLFARANLRKGSAVFYGYVGRTYMKVDSKVKGSINAGPLGQFDLNESIETDLYDYGYGVGLDLFGSDQVAMHMRWLRIFDEKDQGEEAQVDAVFVGFTQYIDRPKRYIRKRQMPVRKPLGNTANGQDSPVTLEDEW